MACDLVWPPISLCRELPAKSAAEAKRHQKLHEQIVAAARRKGQQYKHKLPVLSSSSFGSFTVSNISDRKGLADVAQLSGETLHDVLYTSVRSFLPTVVCIHVQWNPCNVKCPE